MPSQHMLPKGKRRHTVKPAYRAQRGAEPEPDAQVPALQVVEEAQEGTHLRHFQADPVAVRGKRLDVYLAKALPEISRARVQLWIEQDQVRVNGRTAKASLKLEGGEWIELQGDPRPSPLKAEAEDIPISIVYQDADLAVVDKPAGMMVHAGAGTAEHNRGTLVNALLFHLQPEGLSAGAGGVRPGIVHRLDKGTSGLILVAKNDATHQRLARMFADRELRKIYLALVHGSMTGEQGTVDLPIARDPLRRTRMTVRRSVDEGARPAVSHWRVLQRLGSVADPGPLGVFTLLEVRIETGRTHQIRAHLAALGHPVVGDTTYGAPRRLRRTAAAPDDAAEPTLDRNFLHAAELALRHPRTGKALELSAPLPAELTGFLERAGGHGPLAAAAAAPGTARTRRSSKTAPASGKAAIAKIKAE